MRLQLFIIAPLKCGGECERQRRTSPSWWVATLIFHLSAVAECKLLSDGIRELAGACRHPKDMKQDKYCCGSRGANESRHSPLLFSLVALQSYRESICREVALWNWFYQKTYTSCLILVTPLSSLSDTIRAGSRCKNINLPPIQFSNWTWSADRPIMFCFFPTTTILDYKKQRSVHNHSRTSVI